MIGEPRERDLGVPALGGERDLTGVTLALASALAFSTLGIWGKLAQSAGLGTETLLTWRFALSALLLLAVGYGRERLPLGARGRMFAFGLLYAVATTCFFAALARISAGTTGLLLYLAPAFVVLYAALLGRKPGAAQLAALTLTLLGLGVVVGLPGEGDRSALGLLFGALAGAIYGAYLLGSERVLAKLPPLTITMHVAAGAALYFAVAGAVQGTLGVPVGTVQWGVVLAMMVFPTLIALPTLFGAVARLGATRASILATTEPVWTVLLAALILGEQLRGGQLLGGLLILAGAALAQLPARRDGKPPTL